MSASKDLLRGLTAISQTKGNPKIVISTKAVYGCVGSDPSGDLMGHSPKAKMRWSPVARGARGGNTARGACAFPYRNKQCEVLQTSSAPIEVAERSDPAAARKSSYFIPPTSCLSLVSFRPNVSAWRGAKETIALWAILRSRKRPERVNRNKQCEALQASSAPIEIADIPCYDEVAFNQRNRTHLGAISSTIIHFSFLRKGPIGLFPIGPVISF